MATCTDPEEGGTGGPDPAEKSKKYRVVSNTGPDPLEITKLPSQYLMMDHLLGVFGSSLPSSANPLVVGAQSNMSFSMPWSSVNKVSVLSNFLLLQKNFLLEKAGMRIAAKEIPLSLSLSLSLFLSLSLYWRHKRHSFKTIAKTLWHW